MKGASRLSSRKAHLCLALHSTAQALEKEAMHPTLLAAPGSRILQGGRCREMVRPSVVYLATTGVDCLAMAISSRRKLPWCCDLRSVLWVCQVLVGKGIVT